jgi:hypothetical protein
MPAAEHVGEEHNKVNAGGANSGGEPNTRGTSADTTPGLRDYALRGACLSGLASVPPRSSTVLPADSQRGRSTRFLNWAALRNPGCIGTSSVITALARLHLFLGFAIIRFPESPRFSSIPLAWLVQSTRATKTLLLDLCPGPRGTVQDMRESGTFWRKRGRENQQNYQVSLMSLRKSSEPIPILVRLRVWLIRRCCVTQAFSLDFRDERRRFWWRCSANGPFP